MPRDFSIIHKNLSIDFDIQDDNWEKIEFQELVIEVAQAVIDHFNLNTSKIEFSVVLTDDDSIHKLNLEYLDKDKPTNTLSFPIEEINLKDNLNNLDKNSFLDGFVLLGDVIFAYNVIQNEAGMQKKEFTCHFTHLLVHSLLHLLGFDHQTDLDAEEMEGLEIKILAELGIKSPY